MRIHHRSNKGFWGLLTLLSLAAMPSAMAAPSLAPAPASSPTRVEVQEAQLSFELPDGVAEVPVTGAVDSLVKTYEGSDLKLLMDYGAYSDSFRSIPDGATELQVQQETIGGKSGKIVTYRRATRANGEAAEYPYFAGVHFADLGRGPLFKLSFSANAKSPEAQASAVKMMRSLVFR